MKHIVGVASMKVSSSKGDVIVTHALGSCLGISMYDAAADVGGLLHVMLPLSKIDKAKAALNPCMFVDTGVPALYRECLKAGAARHRLVIKVAGGATFREQGDLFAIGKRNYVTLQQLLSRNGLNIAAEDVGGTISRTMFLYIGTGKTVIKSGYKEWEL